MSRAGLARCLAHSQPAGNVTAQLVVGLEISMSDSSDVEEAGAGGQ